MKVQDGTEKKLQLINNENNTQVSESGTIPPKKNSSRSFQSNIKLQTQNKKVFVYEPPLDYEFPDNLDEVTYGYGADLVKSMMIESNMETKPERDVIDSSVLRNIILYAGVFGLLFVSLAFLVIKKSIRYL